MDDLTVIDVPEASRWEARRGDELLGLIDYRRAAGAILYRHTEVLSAAEGQGVGSALARAALDAARAEGLRVQPACPFVAEYIRRHAGAYGDLVDEAWSAHTGG